MATSTNSSNDVLSQVSPQVADFFAGQDTTGMTPEDLEEMFAVYVEVLDDMYPGYEDLDADAQYEARQAAFSAWIDEVQAR